MKKKHPFEAIEEIYLAYYPYLKNYLLKLTINEDIANDIIQELFSKILKDPSRISQVQHMKSWLTKASKNTLLDYYKKKKPELFQDENLIEDLLVNYQTPESKAVINAQIEAALKDLSKRDRSILLAKFYYGYNYEEISELLNISITTIKSTVFRIRKQMAKRG
ncbi:RNA polymerase [Solibacillus sp. R5-41]|uniref:RNA polymerase sigma factor n=1 Tax=Solibacillus sp. R5-41 TaxID=2048654 RepID=UPI000C126EF9|nr:RNA polymerase sigma factor [Solibacillus sp. R5-41]ATP40644.1 RNA polymerase [Solibacillus sp. R5-41]